MEDKMRGVGNGERASELEGREQREGRRNKKVVLICMQ